jgi:hypothetical protein
MTAQEIYFEATRRGLRLDAAGDKLAVMPAKRCPPDFADVLRQHKGELLNFLEARAAGLMPDEIPWLHVAKQVLAGEFDGCDNATRESLAIGLRSIAHPLARRSLEKLKL